MTCLKTPGIFYSYYNLCETRHCREPFLFLMWTGLFILISISVWEDNNDEWWFSSYRFHKSESYSGRVLLISSYFIRSTNHHHHPITHEDHLISVYIPELVSRLPQVCEENKQITGSQADAMNKEYTRQEQEEELAGKWSLWNDAFPPFHATCPAEVERMKKCRSGESSPKKERVGTEWLFISHTWYEEKHFKKLCLWKYLKLKRKKKLCIWRYNAFIRTKHIHNVKFIILSIFKCTIPWH